MTVLSSQVNSKAGTGLLEFTQGLDVDALLFEQEIKVQKAWARALAKAAYLTEEESSEAVKGLEEARQLIIDGQFPWRIEDEDIHMNLERFLTDKSGSLGKKIHYGRSRNDLIATTLRLYVSQSLGEVHSNINELGEEIKQQALNWMKTLIPGMTHLQYGQPIRFGHIISAYAYQFNRDLKRISNAQQSCLDALPLGAAAFAGTHLSVDLNELKNELGFNSVLNHSYDAIGDRDFILESLNAFSIVAVHLSRFCEEIMFWSSSPIGVLNLPPSYSTGSSIMPNKRNPDVPELIRAKMGRVISLASEGQIIVKAVTPSYGTDLHELKRTFVLSLQELQSSLNIFKPFLNGLEINEPKAAALLNSGHVLATEISNTLVEQGFTFREAYQQSARLVEQAQESKKQVHQTLSHEFSDQISFEKAVETKCNTGGTAKATALDAINKLDFKTNLL
ncbi:MAG: argininosuccinate lyase [Bdellovibrionaceae bacterium]|jgi:argininosuccinate lyase|nr:argininosuccinate lyase [Pseudobdellovibrionaceae bacterium]